MKIRDAKSKEEFIDRLTKTYKRHREAVDAYTEDTDMGPERLRYVVVYSLNRAYGGPEEGGWYYDQGTVEQSIRFLNEKELRVYLGAIWDVCRPVVEEARVYTSAAGGIDYEVRFSYGPGVDYPVERPRYE